MHQNRFHHKALQALAKKFANITDANSVSEADRELWEYFATMYKNSNKGIKGRGKAQPASASQSPKNSTLSQFPVDAPPAALHHQGYNGSQHMSPQSDLSSGDAMSYPAMGRPNGHGPPMLGTHLAHDMYGTKVDDCQVMGANTAGPIYDGHVRDVSFHGRGF